jgi:hypothetical protein
VLLDLLFFFFVGRLYNPSCRGIDRLFPWGIFMGFGAVYPSIANYFEFLRHSISMYEIHCRWPAVSSSFGTSNLILHHFLLISS